MNLEMSLISRKVVVLAEDTPANPGKYDATFPSNWIVPRSNCCSAAMVVNIFVKDATFIIMQASQRVASHEGNYTYYHKSYLSSWLSDPLQAGVFHSHPHISPLRQQQNATRLCSDGQRFHGAILVTPYKTFGKMY